MSRKLRRTVSTCCEDMDILDEALSELGTLNLNNQRRTLIRQSWAKRNIVGSTAKLRSSLGSCSSSSSSSSTSTSGNSFSLSSSSISSFSSSRSATLSSSESWDSFSDEMVANDLIGPKLVRRCSKPKTNHFRPYCKPRRFSLQLVSHPESPEIADDLIKTNISDELGLEQDIDKHLHLVNPSIQLSPPKFSRLSEREKENLRVKSNPTSPSKSDVSISSICIDGSYLFCSNLNQEKIFSSTMPMGILVRSKSLDDLTCIGTNDSDCFLQKPSNHQTTASSCDVENVLQRISTLQV